MIYFTPYETIIALTAFFILGCFFGGVYNLCGCFCHLIKTLIFLPITAYLKYKKTYKSAYNIRQNSVSLIAFQCVDFLFVLFIGISYILLTYIFLDGAIRIFSLIFFIIGYILALKVISPFFSKAINKAVVLIQNSLEQTAYVILFPIFRIFCVIKKLISPIILILSEKYRSKKIKLLIKRKNKYIEKNLLKNI